MHVYGVVVVKLHFRENRGQIKSNITRRPEGKIQYEVIGIW